MDNGGVTWKWLSATFATIVILGGGAWMTTMYAEVAGVKRDQKEDRASVQEIKSDVKVIIDRARRAEEDIKEIKEQQHEQGRKLDELLRRTK
jgi:hypothetical protein